MGIRNWSRKDIEEKDIKDLKGMYIVMIGLHMVFELLYAYIGCMPMYIANIPATLFYLISVRFIKKNYAFLFMLLAYMEVSIHFTIASAYIGMDYGFYLPLIGLLVGFWFATVKYCSQKVEAPLRICYSAFSVFALLCVYARAIYLNEFIRVKTAPGVVHAIFIFNVLCTFTFVIAHLSLNHIRILEEETYLTKKAEYDELTGLRNRIGLDHEIKKINLASDNNQEVYSVAMLDIDLFKEINDTYGHMVGDQVLRELGSIFDREVKKGIICGRWGGEEFLFITFGKENVDNFPKEMERLRDFIEGHLFRTGNIMIQLTVSIGIGSREGVLDRRAVDLADQRLYKAKNSGRNRVVVA